MAIYCTEEKFEIDIVVTASKPFISLLTKLLQILFSVRLLIYIVVVLCLFHALNLGVV